LRICCANNMADMASVLKKTGIRNRHCERSQAIQSRNTGPDGLPRRFARPNDE
jgi:hypothetical protein